MLFKLIRKLADEKQVDSLATKLRKRRFRYFTSFLASIPSPIVILDVGGTQVFWETMGFDTKRARILILNRKKIRISLPNFHCSVGDARNMKQYKDKEFDVVFSNSVIEHVGSKHDQYAMAREVRRVGNYYFIQSPNKYFPIEPHFLFPFFQFLPFNIKIWLLTHFCLGRYSKAPNKKTALKIIHSIRLLSEEELKELFPDGEILKEKILGLTKSFIVHNMLQGSKKNF